MTYSTHHTLLGQGELLALILWGSYLFDAAEPLRVSEQPPKGSSGLVSADTKVTALFVVLGLASWLGARRVTDSQLVQLVVLFGVGVVVPTSSTSGESDETWLSPSTPLISADSGVLTRGLGNVSECSYPTVSPVDGSPTCVRRGDDVSRMQTQVVYANTSNRSRMSRGEAVGPAHIEEYWEWFAVALFVLVTLDLVTTAGAVAKYGLDAEANPLFVWLIRQGPVALFGAHLVVVVLAAAAFAGVIHSLRQTAPPYDRYFAYFVEVWLGLLLAVGLFIIANNLSVVVLGNSLL